MHKLPDIVYMDINVFGLLCLKWISGVSNGSLIVTIDDNGNSDLNPHSCNIPNFDLILMGITPIDYDFTLMFYSYILSLGPHCI